MSNWKTVRYNPFSSRLTTTFSFWILQGYWLLIFNGLVIATGWTNMKSHPIPNCKIWHKPITSNFKRVIWNRPITAYFVRKNWSSTTLTMDNKTGTIIHALCNCQKKNRQLNLFSKITQLFDGSFFPLKAIKRRFQLSYWGTL